MNLPAITTILTCDAVICAQFKRTNSDVQFGNYSELGSPAFTAHNDDARPGRAEQSRGWANKGKAKGMNSSVTALLSFSCFWCWLQMKSSPVVVVVLVDGGGGGGAVDFLTKIYRK